MVLVVVWAKLSGNDRLCLVNFAVILDLMSAELIKSFFPHLDSNWGIFQLKLTDSVLAEKLLGN